MCWDASAADEKRVDKKGRQDLVRVVSGHPSRVGKPSDAGEVPSPQSYFIAVVCLLPSTEAIMAAAKTDTKPEAGATWRSRFAPLYEGCHRKLWWFAMWGMVRVVLLGIFISFTDP
eukprot:1414378-Rhodomonas_salina.4